MRKEIYYGLSVILVLAAIGTASAIDGVSSAARTNTGGHGPGFIDADGDGICDNFVDNDGDGINDNRSMYRGARMGSGFVDADGDGICDNMGSGRGHGGVRYRATR
jgi:hypothetical protein